MLTQLVEGVRVPHEKTQVGGSQQLGCGFFSRPQCAVAHSTLRTCEDETPSETDSPRVSHGSKSPVRASPARHRGSFLAGTRVCQSSERDSKNRAFDARVSWFDRICPTAHVLELCVPPVPLCVVEAFGGYADSGDVEGALERPHLHLNVVQASLGEKLLFEPACDIDGLRSLPLRLRGKPTFRDIACTRLASATAPASRSGKQSGLVTRTSILASRWRSVLWSPVTASIRR